MCAQRAAKARPLTRWERFVRWTRVGDFRWYMVPGYGITYRTAMRIGHRFNWHYMPPNYGIEGGGVYRRCSWCGVYHVMSRELEALAEARRKGLPQDLRIATKT